MSIDPERAARIIESQEVGRGSSTHSTLCAMAAQVRTMRPDRDIICQWVGAIGQLRGIDANTLMAMTDAITDDGEVL